jgi:hypothetical protein
MDARRFRQPEWRESRGGKPGRPSPRRPAVRVSDGMAGNGGRRQGGPSGQSFPPDRASEDAPADRRVAPCRRSARGPPGCSWPEHPNESSTGRSSGSRLVQSPDRLPAFWAVAWYRPGALPITAAAPRWILTIFPILSRTVSEPGAPVERPHPIRTIGTESMNGPFVFEDRPSNKCNRGFWWRHAHTPHPNPPSQGGRESNASGSRPLLVPSPLVGEG